MKKLRKSTCWLSSKFDLPRNYLSKHRLLNEEDRDIVLNDLSYLTHEPAEGVNVDLFVSHMRNMLEGFAR